MFFVWRFSDTLMTKNDVATMIVEESWVSSGSATPARMAIAVNALGNYLVLVERRYFGIVSSINHLIIINMEELVPFVFECHQCCTQDQKHFFNKITEEYAFLASWSDTKLVEVRYIRGI